MKIKIENVEKETTHIYLTENNSKTIVMFNELKIRKLKSIQSTFEKYNNYLIQLIKTKEQNK